MQTTIFWTAKRGNSTEEYEDAAAADPALARFVLADGAAESSFAAAWARLLVNGFVACPVPWTRRWTEWLPPLQAEWAADVDSRPLPWYAEAKREQGAFATFLGLVFVRQRWHAVAVGDCCLFQLRGDRLCQAFPLDRSADFSTSPQLLGSRTPPAEVPRSRALCIRGEWQPGDRFWLMSDALAQWFLRETETGEQPGEILGELVAAPSPGDEFSAWIEQLRNRCAIRNDDVTLLAMTP